VVTTLAFHGIGEPSRPLEPGEERYWLSEAMFERVLDAVEAAERRGRRIRLTFDDGNKSDVTHALPILARRGLSASFFIIAGRIDQPGSLSAADLAMLKEHGMDLGTHGRTHIPWTRLTTAELRDELEQSCAAIAAATGDPVREASFPLGAYRRRVLSVLRAFDFDHVYSVAGGPSRPGRWLQHRTSLMRTHQAHEIEELLLGVETRALHHKRRAKRLVRRIV
jgi:peptidoglycan/xylan/chitin deacetylase (PgdA/CDA1 family)